MADRIEPRTDERAAGIILFRRSKAACEFLLLRNAKHRSWGFPKGHTDAGESPLETARRETLEETGIVQVRLVETFHETITYTVNASAEAPNSASCVNKGSTGKKANSNANGAPPMAVETTFSPVVVLRLNRPST